MASKTPRTTVKDYLQSVNTENEAHRVLRRRSVGGDGERAEASVRARRSASQKQDRMEARSPHTAKNSIRPVVSSGEEEVTPRHLIQNMLTVQGTAQPVTRKRKRMSDVVMGPPTSAGVRKSARRRSSISALDLDDVTRKHTPRTSIVGFLEQASEETPAVRKSSSSTDSRSTTQNVSPFMVNEVGVSLLETGSGSDGGGNVSTTGSRFRGKRGNLNIPLPQVSMASPSQVEQTPEVASSSKTSTPRKDVTTDEVGNVSEAAGELSPVADVQRDGQSEVGSMNPAGEQSLRDAGDQATPRPSHSSATSTSSAVLENRESLHTAGRNETSEVPENAEEGDCEAGASTHTAVRHDSTQRSEQDESSEEEGYSPLKTPRLPEKQRTPSIPFSRLEARNVDETARASTAGTGKKTGASYRRKKAREGLPTSVVKATFSHFCQLRVSKEAIEEVEKMSEQFWKNMAEDLEAYANHAHRNTITEADVELLMKRQGFITDTCSLNTLIAKYLPLELRQELIPIARSGNKLEPKC